MGILTHFLFRTKHCRMRKATDWNFIGHSPAATDRRRGRLVLCTQADLPHKAGLCLPTLGSPFTATGGRIRVGGGTDSLWVVHRSANPTSAAGPFNIDRDLLNIGFFRLWDRGLFCLMRDRSSRITFNTVACCRDDCGCGLVHCTDLSRLPRTVRGCICADIWVH